jgi:hypothetical protein
MNHKSIIIFFLCHAIFVSCETRTASQKEHQVYQEVSIQPVKNVPEYYDAILVMEEPSEYNLKSGNVKFVFDVRNFSMEGGSYIMMNLNNEKFYPSVRPEIPVQLTKGKYVAVAFLCLENHVSLKNYGNYVVRTFDVQDSGQELYDEAVPMIFYNYPRGKIKLEDDGQLLLDFYLLNTSLEPDGHKVKVELDGHEFMVTEWIPYALEGVRKGKHNLTLTLLNRDGQVVESPFHKATSTFELY